MRYKLKYFSRLLLIYLLISNALCQITVFPEHYVATDSPYSSSSLYLTSDIKERQIYKLGYFTTGNLKIKSYKYGLIYSPDNYCVDDSGAQMIGGQSESNSMFINWINNPTSTRDNSNFSEELKLLSYYCSGRKLVINTPFPILHNTGYILKYKLSMTNDCPNKNTNININVGLRITPKVSSSYDIPICVFGTKGLSADWFKMNIKSKQTVTNKITMIFTCDGENDVKSDFNTDDSFKFTFEIGNPSYNIYISFYQVLLEDSSSAYISSYNTNNIIRTYNGMEKCDTINDENKCLIGYACSAGSCTKCDDSCFECSNNGQCQNCNVLTDVDNTGTGVTCEKNYIDFSNFEDIKVNVKLFSNEFHERSTMGFWIFISDMSRARLGNSNIYHVVLKDRYVLSIIPNELSTGVYIHAYEDLYRKITSETLYETYYTDRESDYVLYRKIPTAEQLKYINGQDLSGQWFHVSCALSFDHKMFHVSTVINGEQSYIESALRHENLYYDSIKNEYVENDIYNRHIINDGQNLVVEFKNFGKAGSKVYLKYFLLFQEYIPPSYKYMYYDYSQYAGTILKDYLLLRINFDKLDESSNSYKFLYSNLKVTNEPYDLEVSSMKSIDLSPPQNFKLFKLPKYNQAYQRIDCDTQYSPNIISSDNNIVYWDKNMPLFCTSYLNTKTNSCVDSGLCAFNGNNYISYPGFEEKGYCDLICSGSINCIKNYEPGTFCKVGDDNIYNLYYSCENKQTKYYLQYSSFYSSQNIDITLPKELNSFIVEIWYYPDFFLSDTNRQGKFYYPESTKNYVFWSNTVTAYFLHSEYKKLKVEDAASTYTSDFYNPYEWNKLLFYGKHDGKNLYKYFIINNLVSDYIRFKLTNPVPLNSIKFFRSTIENDANNYWATGYYRGLRIWDGTLATPELTVIYDNYYSSGPNRIKSLLYYYPLTNEYIADNTIREIIGAYNPEVADNLGDGVGVSPGKFRLRKYNFSSKFDFIRSQYPSMQYYLAADATAPKAFPCSTGCLRCWNSGNSCYECVQGYMLTLQRACVKVDSYYFKSPCTKCPTNNVVDAELIIKDEVYTEAISPITVTFWVKTIGFNSDSPHYFVYYSQYDFLKYDENKGLVLISELTKEIAIDKDFRDKIGKWTYIALSYYYFNNDPKTYFPKMVNFEINGESLEIITPPNKMIFKTFTIPKNLYAFFCNVRYYHEYLVGAYGFATNEGNMISPFSIPKPKKSYLVPGSSASNCFDYNDLNNGNYFECAGEKDILFDTFATSFNNYIEIERGQGQPKACKFKSSDNSNFCLNACKGSNDIDCTCLNRNYNSQMLVKGSKGIYCKTFNYINFSKAKDIKIRVKTARETKKFTLQFWVYFINYEPLNFDGATFNWDGHTKIFIIKEDNKYKTYCEIYYMDNRLVTPKETKKYELNHDKWNFISCSINYEERLFYINLNNDKDLSENNDLDGPHLYPDTISNSEVPEFILNNDWTYLEIKDNTNLDDWGYLFYRQIHLWKDAYFNAEFLSRVNILTHSKFPYLLHSWDTHFIGYKDGDFLNNFRIKDLCESAEDIVVTKVDTLGFNYVSEFYANQDIELCSEDGEYYDIYTSNEDHCLPFADLGSIEDFSFTDVPFSYSGTYSMAFWIFFEDSSTMGSGIHFQWERHLQITIIKLTQLEGYCLPQGR